jgi:S-DNA-T family DNA segregation ATPase FtsK/SpoIIIE
MNKKAILESVFAAHKVDATVIDIVRGPSITQYQVKPGYGVRIKQITALENDIAMAMAAKDIRIEAPIPGKSAIGIEIPNEKCDPVYLSELSKKNTEHPLIFPLGVDFYGNAVYGDLRKMPHLLVAGATGSGKSVCINGIICSIITKASPESVKLLLIDPKKVEFVPYNGVPHLLQPVITKPVEAAKILASLVVTMKKRYEELANKKVRNIQSYNAIEGIKKMPYIVTIIDEMADLMMTAPDDVETSVARITQLARAAGIHLIIATQRPSVNVITGIIKANIPSRIAFAVSSGTDSRVILDTIGAEKLLGAGDMLYLPVGEPKPVRVQGAFVSDEEVNNYVESAKIHLKLTELNVI